MELLRVVRIKSRKRIADEMHMKTVNLDGVVMRVSSTSENGVVDANTRLYFTQKGASVFARYSGGSVKRGCLAGTIYGANLIVRYAQLEESGKIHGSVGNPVQVRTQCGLECG